MRTSFGIACMCIAAQSFALDWGMVKHALLTSTFGENYESHPVYQFHGSNRSSVRENHKELLARKVQPLNREQRQQAINAHHSIQARRARLGLK